MEFSRRAPAAAGGREAAQVDSEIARRYQRLAFRCQHYDGTAAVVQKVLALAGRPVTQARDVFDLDVLQRGGHTRNLALQTLVSAERRAAAAANARALDFDASPAKCSSSSTTSSGATSTTSPPGGRWLTTSKRC